MKRLATAAIGAPIFFVIIKYLSPWWFFALLGVAAILGTYELHALARRKGVAGNRLLGAFFSLAVIATFVDSRLDLAAVLAVAVVTVPLARLWDRAGVEGAIESIALTLAGALFVGIPLGYLAALMGRGEEMSRDLIVFLFLVIWLADAGAYWVGSAVGKHKLSPTVSPNKTIEGALGGLALSLLAAGLANAWFFQKLKTRDALLLAVLLWAAGLLGDLSESLLKRAASVKDCGEILPGHGGLLDRADSLLFGAPVLFFYYKSFIA